MPLGACFTGVESTPKIDSSELKRAKAAKVSEEEIYMSSVSPQPASQWKEGKLLIVTDPKIRMVLTLGEGGIPFLEAGDKLEFKKFVSVPSMMGNDDTEAVFSSSRYPDLRFRISSTVESLLGENSQSLEIPFTVDPLVAAQADRLIKSNPRECYILTSIWYDPLTEKETLAGGYRLVPVKLDSVSPGNHIYPLKIYFHVADSELNGTERGRGEKMVFASPSSTRSFATLFTFSNPRKKHPEITSETWSLIINSRVREGMTKEECRLALGSPSTVDSSPTRTGDIERWGYSDGIYLLFNPEGMLIRYRL